MADARERAEQLAAEKWPDYSTVIGNVSMANYRAAFIDGHLTARTITAEELEAAARGLFLWDTEDHPEPRPAWRDLSEAQKGIWRSGACAAFESAGFTVEGGE